MLKEEKPNVETIWQKLGKVQPNMMEGLVKWGVQFQGLPSTATRQWGAFTTQNSKRYAVFPVPSKVTVHLLLMTVPAHNYPKVFTKYAH